MEAIATQVIRYLSRLGYLDKDGEIVEAPALDNLFRDNEAITVATAPYSDGTVA